ncbi:MAG: FAD-dependent thymidylate synthase [Oscillospiraceae bacterium]|nr:FAD-dependent thymidylate synthase [Oscillospiraceae bacterium]
MSTAKIISYNLHGEAVCAGAARISTTKGSALEIFEHEEPPEKNRALIGKVLASGHKSLLEHAVFTLALENVSVFVEEFFIECRLASFTVKSRRYVDFGASGYYIPETLEGAALARYRDYMERLFSAYRSLLELGAPKEDARFLLPYSFHSNFYCTVNARELARMINGMLSERCRGIPELRALASQLVSQLEELFPAMLSEFDQAALRAPAEEFSPAPAGEAEEAPRFFDRAEAGIVELLACPADAPGLLREARRFGGEAEEIDYRALFRAERPRELEMLPYTFAVRGVTLAAVTHLVRHRMQSIIVPPIRTMSCGRMIVPPSIRADEQLMACYRDAAEAAFALRRELMRDPELKKYPHYYALSGNLTDVLITMNARELLHFIRLRSCTRAQWEVRGVTLRLLSQLRESFPELFCCAGPSCYVYGRCPEGRLSCGRAEEIAGQLASGELLL